jgi:hypothetical protein
MRAIADGAAGTRARAKSAVWTSIEENGVRELS